MCLEAGKREGEEAKEKETRAKNAAIKTKMCTYPFLSARFFSALAIPFIVIAIANAIAFAIIVILCRMDVVVVVECDSH